MSSDQDDRGRGKDDDRAQENKDTAPPPPLFDADNTDDKTVVAPRRSAPGGGLGQMFSRDPAPVRGSLPNAEEGDALLDLLFEDAKRGDDRPSEPTAPPVAAAERRAPPPRPVAKRPDPPAAPRPAPPPPVKEEHAVFTADGDDDDDDDVEDVDDSELEAPEVDAPAADASGSSIPTRAHAALAFEGEEDAATQLGNAGLRDAWAARAAWLREEALADADKASRARGLLVVSELRAMSGEEGPARDAALEAREAAPNSPLPHRQIRGLCAREANWAGVLEVVEGEGKSVSTPGARAHLALLGSEVARIALGDDDQARRRLELGLRILPSDPRAHLHRLAASLAEADSADGGATLQKTRFPEAPDLAPLVGALGSLLAHRGLAPKTRVAATPYEGLLRARADFEADQPANAVNELADVDAQGTLSGGVGWLVAVLAAARKETRPRAAERLRALLDGSHGALARRSLAARAIELGDAEAAKSAIETEHGGAFSAADRVALTALSGGAKDTITVWHDALWNDEELAPIAAAVDAALDAPSADRLPRAIGSSETRAAVTLGRALASMSTTQIESALGVFVDGAASSGVDRALGLELDVEARAGGRIARAVAGWREGDELERERLLASALIAEVSGEPERAQDDFEKARAAEPTLESA
ncbi:MAG TPA: hypothetical protein VGM56_17465, partial [Byssovorax sp.]